MEGEISAGICAHNEEETIGDLLEQIESADVPIKQIVVVVAGEDRTIDIAREKAEENDKIEVIEEEEREGQSAAQNKILRSIEGEHLLMIDGDGIVEEGSIEELFSSYDEGCIVAGREAPLTDNSLLGGVVEAWTRVHDRLCSRSPRFATHLGVIPSDLVESFPEDLVIDDIYVEHRAFQEDLSIEYEEEAVKHHNMPQSWHFFFNQQRKNWSGRFQAEEKGYTHTKPDGLLVEVFVSEFLNTPVRNLPQMILLGVLETSAYLSAKIDSWREDYPFKWKRPGISRESP